ncbi:MAG: hypothetical protein ACYCOO_03530 [Chitinophagaceae bacterium]
MAGPAEQPGDLITRDRKVDGQQHIITYFCMEKMITYHEWLDKSGFGSNDLLQ